MSVIVKDMKLPRGCRECPFINAHIWDGSTLCFAMGKQIASNHEPIEYEGRHPDCPLEEADDEEPLVHDGFCLCDKKPGACPSWQKYGWTKCMSLYCNRTSRLDHALKLPDADDGWIPIEEKLPDKYGWYLCTLKDGRVNCYYWNNKGEWLDNGKKHFFELYHVFSKLTGMEVLAKNEESVYWTDWVIAWQPLPKSYGLKEDRTYCGAE